MKSILISFMFILISVCCSKSADTVKDIDGNVYNTVVIGKYRWMAENLRTTTYNNGVEIPVVSEQSVWFRLGNDACCQYKNDQNYADTFGLLYNWYAVNTGSLCPVGWRVPTDEEWKYLEGSVDSRYGVGDPHWDRSGLRGEDAGLKLKNPAGWRPGINGTDNYGFSALPGGERLSRFYAGGSSGFWWSSTGASESSAWYRSLIYSYEYAARDTHPKRMGFSVRCITDIIQKPAIFHPFL